jgi:hypothetical protein
VSKEKHYYVDTDARLIVVGNEGNLKVTGAEPRRTWVRTRCLGENRARLEDVIMLLGGGQLAPGKGGVIADGSYRDPLDGLRRFYCRILPDDARESLKQFDETIAETERTLAHLRQGRQEFLASCARRGARVPAPPQAPKPAKETVS